MDGSQKSDYAGSYFVRRRPIYSNGKRSFPVVLGRLRVRRVYVESCLRVSFRESRVLWRQLEMRPGYYRVDWGLLARYSYLHL